MPAISDSHAIAFHPSWPASAKTLMLRAIDRHGGWSLWSRLESVTLGLASLEGLLPWVKGYGRSFKLPRSLTTFPRLGRTEWNDDATRRCVGVFDRGDVRLLEPESGEIRAESRDHRDRFVGLRKLRRWSTLDAFFFFGYAFASYSGVPFMLPGLRFQQEVSGKWRGESLAGVRLEFPPGSQVHSRAQSYFFDASGLLRRNDYVADVVGPWATGAHGWDDHVTVKGLPIPARRTVLFRMGTAYFAFPRVLSATFENFGVNLAGA